MFRCYTIYPLFYHISHIFICGLTNSFLSSRNHLTLMYTKNEYFPILHLWQKSIKKKIGFIDKVYRFPFTALDCIQKLMSEGVIVECFMLSTQHGWAVTHYPIKWKKFLHVQILLTKLLTRDMLSWGSISQIFLPLKNILQSGNISQTFADNIFVKITWLPFIREILCIN